MKQKNLDNRMGWIRNLEKLDQSEENSYWHDYEIASECRINGELDYGNRKISCRFLTLDKNENGLYLYLLRIQYTKVDCTPNDQASKEGYYFINGAVGELLSLFSLFFQCRFYLIATYCYNTPRLFHQRTKIEHNFVYKKCDEKIHPKIFSDEPRNFSIGLSEFLDDIKKLKNEKHQSFILACWHYARSLKEASLDREMVYIRLVSAVEALSKSYKLKEEDDPLKGKDFCELFEGASLTKTQSDRLREILHVNDNDNGEINIVDKASLKFRSFIINYAEEFPYTLKQQNVLDHLHVTPENLEETLKTIYNARSNYLHQGDPMYLSKIMKDGCNWDFDASVGRVIDNRKNSFNKEKSLVNLKLPYPYWFENLVRHCLLKWFEEKKISS